jgi:hypothetical protein
LVGSCSKVGSSEKVSMMNGIENVRDTGPKRRGSEFEKMVSGEEYNWTDPELMERKEILTPRVCFEYCSEWKYWMTVHSLASALCSR